MKLKELFPLSYCVNMDERTDRWNACQAEFDKLNFYPERFSAIKDANPAFGCWQSHLAILKQAQREDKNVLIFEDDVEIMPGAEDTVERALDEFENIEWDMFYLGGNILMPFFQVTDHLARLQHCQSTHSYGVNKKLLPLLVPFIEANKVIIDVLYANYVVPSTRCFITVPMVAIQRASYSDIEKQMMDYSVPMARYQQFLIKKGK